MQTTETVGILVRQKTSSTLNGEKLRDAQKEAYERQMLHETGLYLLHHPGEVTTRRCSSTYYRTMENNE